MRIAGLAAMLGPGCLRPLESSPDALAASPADASSGAAADVATTDAVVSDSGNGGRPADAGTPDGGGTDATVAPWLASTVVAQSAGTVDALVADGAALYWVTSDNVLWALDTGSGTPRRLAQDPASNSACRSVNRLAANATDLFWLRQSLDAQLHGATVHRTAKSGANDVVIASGLRYADTQMVAADQTRVYWVEGQSSLDNISPASAIRALPVDASPGTTPTTLVETDSTDAIGNMRLDGPTLYWVSVFLYTTVFRPALYEEAISDLLAPQPPPAQLVTGSWFVQPHDGDLYVEIIRDLWNQDLGRIAPGSSTPVDLAPIDGEDNIVFVDDWALVSVPTDSCGNHRHSLIAVRTSGSPGVVVALADDLGTPAVLGTDLAFVDITGQVHTSTLDQVRAALPAASP